ncbi:Alpha/Beta hydrolase protein [Cytidiella melzeri]|nr:Alpha/Beta hydrolase protein [Cytidiella melzeri]
MAWPTSLFTSSSSISEASGASESKSDTHSTASYLPEAVTDLLKHFEAPGVPPPPSSRVGDPTLKQRESQPIRLWHLWRYATFVAWKASGLVAAVVSHHMHGPQRKSWGIEMTVLTSIMRDVNRHTHLADLPMIRMFMSLSGLVPVPSDALVTPVTFTVPRRQLRGILAGFDKAEDGTRELSGEWVVGRRTWERLQTEWQASRRARLGLEKPLRPQKRKERVVLFLHGGAYYLSSPATHRMITIPLSKALDARLFALDYRLAPETRFPGPLHDAVSAYFRLTDDLHIPAENIVIAGDSAGGGLSLALMMYLRDNDYPLPGAAILMSPWIDLTMSCDSWESNAQYDIVPIPLPGDHLNPVACYLGEHMEKYLTHPYASPLFGDFRGLPPLLIQSGDAEVLRDESTLMAHKATLAGVIVRHELYEDAVHVFQTFPFLEQAQQAFHSARAFAHEILKPIDGEASSQLERNVEEKLESEINNEKAQVVQGDGSISSSKKDELCDPERVVVNPTVRDAADSEGGSASQDDEPSWVSQTPWPSPPLSPRDEKRVEFPRCNTARNTASPHEQTGTVSRSRASSITSTLLRLSPLALPKLPLVPPSIPVAPQSSSNSSLRRVRSRPYLKLPETPSYPPSKEYFLAPASISATIASPVPRPSIRRSHSSHPDITVLCDQWAHNGPANQTLTFKPDATFPRRRRKSGSVSSANPLTMGGRQQS